ncbi:sulfotransferase family protein [Nocardioides jejuensis]|uniref:Sulfotransferase n=1 Tax=Nocardioides jejuensis TaxID=2502782 RepID=A0A4R1CJJ1_9ACTN|nr:sulfotransferase [Nocardioides jejuensis]TCJ30168.1 sulfotransferase [Nocardioides jejuensis]
MAVLTRFTREGRPEQVSVQCDVCVPPVLSTSTEAEMRKLGWLLQAHGNALDVCPWCDLSVPAAQRRRRGDASPVTPDPERLPNLVVIGAAKAGSTSLHSYLELHPEVVMSADKEVRFFSDPACRDWVGRYQEYFPAGTRYRGESTPQYTKWPLYPGVAGRMADLAPDAKLIYLVRDPIDRVVAEYVEEATWGVVTGTFEEEMVDLEAQHHRLVAPSRYATQLREFLAHFPREQVLVVDLADMNADATATMDRVFAFLGLPPVALETGDLAAQNAYGSKGAHPGWYQALRQPWLIRLAHKMPSGWLQRVRNVVSRRVMKPVERPVPSPETLARLRAHLAPEVSELRALTGQSFAGWTL